MSYSASNAITGDGTLVEIYISSTWTPIYEIVTAKPSGKKNVTAPATNLNSTAKEFVTTIKDSGSVDLTMNYIATDPGQLGLEAAFLTGALASFKVIFPFAAGLSTTHDILTFSAIVEEFDNVSEISPEKQLMTHAKLLISGSATWTFGS